MLFLFPFANKGERHFVRRPWAVATVVIAAFSTLVLMYPGYKEPWKPFLVNGSILLNWQPSRYEARRAAVSPMALAGGHLMSVEGMYGLPSDQRLGGQRGPDLSQVGDRLTYGQFIWRIARGGGGMPAYGNVLKPPR